MKSKSSNNEFDVIVIGSGMGGMTTATALSRMKHKVLLLEKAQTIGGLTHTFSREGFTWDVGLHYCGMFGHDEPGETVDRLLPRQICEQEWAVEIAAMKTSICHFKMFVGFEGDIA